MIPTSSPPRNANTLNSLGALAPCGDQLLAFLMHDLDDRAPPEQTLVPSALADLGAALPRDLIAHLITDRVAEILGDGQLVGCAPSDRRGHLHRAVVIVADPRPPNGDLAEGGLEGKEPRPPSLDAGAAFAVATL